MKKPERPAPRQGARKADRRVPHSAASKRRQCESAGMVSQQRVYRMYEEMSSSRRCSSFGCGPVSHLSISLGFAAAYETHQLGFKCHFSAESPHGELFRWAGAACGKHDCRDGEQRTVRSNRSTAMRDCSRKCRCHCSFFPGRKEGRGGAFGVGQTPETPWQHR